jgi:hypothetical protein
MKQIYVASSWRCAHQPCVVNALRVAGHEVYDFRHPRADNEGFRWSEISATWKDWTPGDFRSVILDHPIAERGFAFDWQAMKWADTCVLVLPCGRSAHLEAGYFVGAGKALFILILDPCEPELMYKMATGICLSINDLTERLSR